MQVFTQAPRKTAGSELPSSQVKCSISEAWSEDAELPELYLLCLPLYLNIKLVYRKLEFYFQRGKIIIFQMIYIIYKTINIYVCQIYKHLNTVTQLVHNSTRSCMFEVSYGITRTVGVNKQLDKWLSNNWAVNCSTIIDWLVHRDIEGKQ